MSIFTTIKSMISNPADGAWFGDPDYYQNKYPGIVKGPYTTTGTSPYISPYKSLPWNEVSQDHTHDNISRDLVCLQKIFSRFRDQIASKAALLDKLMRANGAILVFDPDKETIEIRDKQGRIYATKPLNEERLINIKP